MEIPLNDEINDLPPCDPTGSRAYAANFQHFNTLKIAAPALFATLLCSVAVNVIQANRPPVVLVVRVNDAGQAEPIRYNSTNYTPREAEIRASLNTWAVDRFRLTKEYSADHFRENYYFMTASLARSAMGQDSARLAAVLAGGEEEDVQINRIEFRTFETPKLPNGVVGSGEVRIDIFKLTGATAAQQKQHWTITLRYEVNPSEAAKRGLREPQFQLLNPIGVSVIWFHEDRAFD
jgi:type IV secretory system VirB8-like protein